MDKNPCKMQQELAKCIKHDSASPFRSPKLPENHPETGTLGAIRVEA